MQAFEARFDEFAHAGAEIIAVTGERPEHFQEAAPDLQQLSFPVLFDDGYSVMRQYGIVYELTPELATMFADRGLDLAEANGTEAATLPLPSVYVVRPDGTIAAAWVEVDHTVRPEVDEVLDAVQSLGGSEAADQQ